MESVDTSMVIRILVAVFIAFVTVAGLVRWRRKLAARSWPMTPGTVEQTCVNEVDHLYFPGLLYSYEVNGEFYSGQHYLPDGCSSSDDALALAAPWLKRQIRVRYNPSRPQTSVFLPQDAFPQ